MRILIVEDEPRMLELLRKGLYEHGYTVMTSADGETGLKTATDYEFDSIVLDVGLPLLDGYELIRALRAQARTTPVLMLTARDTEEDIIRGLDLGADDYLTKPFSFPELIVRLQAITRSHRGDGEGTIEAGDVVVDLIRHTVTRGNSAVDLTRTEFQLLACLARKTGQCVSRQTLTQCVWGPDHAVGPSALDVLVNSLRTKIDGPHRTKTIRTVRGAGYVFGQAADAPGREAK